MFFLRVVINLVIDLVGIGICCVVLLSLLFNFGIIRLIVFVVLVELGMMFVVFVWVWWRLLLWCGLLRIIWLLVYVWIVVIKFCLILKLFCKVLVIGVR